MAVGKTLSPGNTVSWTDLSGKPAEAGRHPAGRPVPGAPGAWEHRPPLCLTRCSVPTRPFCVGKGPPSRQAPGVGPERRNHMPRILHWDVPQRRGPGVALPVPKLSQMHNKGEPWVAPRGLGSACHAHSCRKQTDTQGTGDSAPIPARPVLAGRTWQNWVSSCRGCRTDPARVRWLIQVRPSTRVSSKNPRHGHHSISQMRSLRQSKNELAPRDSL